MPGAWAFYHYAKTRDVYVAYRKAGYSKRFLDAHREEITLHRAAKDAFEQMNVKKLPRIKELSAEYAEVLAKKKAAYPAYRKARAQMQEYLTAQKVAAVVLGKEQEQQEEEQRRQQSQQQADKNR